MNIDVTRTEVIVGNGYIVNKGEYKINPCEFTFSEDYTADLVKKAVFDDGKTQKEMAIINNKCDIPYEVLDINSFELRVYAYRVNGEELELVYSPTPATVFLREGSYRGVTGSGEIITPTQFEQYEQALNDGLQELESGLEEVSNVDIDASKTGNKATVTITNREGTEKLVEIFDGEDYVLTPEDKQEIIDIVEADVSLDIPKKVSELENDSEFIDKEVNNLTNYTLKTSTGSSVVLSINNTTYIMTLQLKDINGNTISTATVDLPLETMVVNASYDKNTKEIVLTLQNGNTVRFSVADLVSGLVSETTFNQAISNINTQIGQINTTLGNKVDKVSGKGLSTNDYTNEEKSKLEDLENYDDTEVQEEIEALQEKNAQLIADHPDILDENNKFPSGTDLTLNGTGDLPMEVDVGGNSTQETTSTSEGDEYDSPSPEHKQDINNVEGDIETKAKNKNLFNPLLLSQETNYNTYNQNTKLWTTNNGSSYFRSLLYSATGSNSERDHTKLFKLKPNTTYTIKLFDFVNNTSLTSNFISIAYFSNNNTIIGEGTSFSNPIFSTTSPNQECYLDIRRRDNSGTFSFSNIMIVEGSYTSEQLDFILFAENTVTFPLAEGQKLMLGDYLADDGIHHKRNQIALNGTEVWNFSSSSNVFYMDVANLNQKTSGNIPLCNYYQGISNVSGVSELQNNQIGLVNNSSLGRIYIKDTNYNNTTDYKTWLSTHNLIIEYELAEETIESYTAVQQEAYNKLKEMQSYYDLTFVVGSSDDAQPILTAHAKKSIKEIDSGDLSNYQEKITSTNKLDSDLVDDTNQTNKFVTTAEKNTWNSKQNSTDNNLQTTNKTITGSINEVNSIAKGANQALSYASYSAMVTAFNSLSADTYNIGQNIYILTLEVPDLWVSSIESTSSTYTYTTDEAFMTALETNGYVQVGYYKLSALETQKVDLTDYVPKSAFSYDSTTETLTITI